MKNPNKAFVLNLAYNDGKGGKGNTYSVQYAKNPAEAAKQALADQKGRTVIILSINKVSSRVAAIMTAHNERAKQLQKGETENE